MKKTSRLSIVNKNEEAFIEGQAGSMQRICAWCNKVMREGTKPATHGMCPKCLEEQRRSLEAQKSHSGS